MWVFTVDGFFSVVENRKNSDEVLVRMREIEDARRLGRAIGVRSVKYTPKADYPFRMVIRKSRWVLYLSDATRRLDYPNFKNRMAKTETPNRMYQLHDVWATMSDYHIGQHWPHSEVRNIRDLGSIPGLDSDDDPY